MNPKLCPAGGCECRFFSHRSATGIFVSERYFCSAGSGRQDCDEWETCAFPKRKGVDDNEEYARAFAEAEMRAEEDLREAKHSFHQKTQEFQEDLENMKREAQARTRQDEAKWQSKKEADVEGERKRQEEEAQWSRKTYEEKVRERAEHNKRQKEKMKDELNDWWEKKHGNTKSKRSGFSADFDWGDDDPFTYGAFYEDWSRGTARASGSTRECFSTLGLSNDATKAEVKRAFREKAKTAHPDKPGGSNEEFQKIQDAYNNAMLYAD